MSDTKDQTEPVRLVQMHPDDNVAVVVNAAGAWPGSLTTTGLTINDRIPQGHKAALVEITPGQAVRRYGVVIGHARSKLAAGTWVHEHRLLLPAAPDLAHLPMATLAARPQTSISGRSFEGFVNADGSVGTRNLLAITTTVQCVVGVLRHAVKRIEAELLPLYSNVDGVVGLEHHYGCGVAIDAPDAVIPIRTLRNISLNPNFGGEVLVLSLGCEKLQPQRLMPATAQKASIPIADASTPDLHVLSLQDPQLVGFEAMLRHIVEGAKPHLERLNQRRRQAVPASKLVVGVQCGGSDALSGITANPAVGHASDLLVRAGATVMFSENTEVRDAVDQLTARAATTEIAQRIVQELDWYDRYLARGHAERSANTTPGNKSGGLSNIVEKAMGSIVKSGSSAIVGVLSPGERLADRGITHGLVFAATPASDFICGTLQLAAGMNMHVFTTGRGTPYGLAECPVIKVATRDDLAQRWHDLIDLNAGGIAEGRDTVESVGLALFELILQSASGQKTWAERHRLHNDLVLFNPAPVT